MRPRRGMRGRDSTCFWFLGDILPPVIEPWHMLFPVSHNLPSFLVSFTPVLSLDLEVSSLQESLPWLNSPVAGSPICVVIHIKQIFTRACFIHCLSTTMKVKVLVAQSCLTLFDPMGRGPHGQSVARQAPLSLGFSRQDYWSGLPYPSPWIFPTQGLNPGLLHCKWILHCLSHQGSPSATEQ